MRKWFKDWYLDRNHLGQWFLLTLIIAVPAGMPLMFTDFSNIDYPFYKALGFLIVIFICGGIAVLTDQAREQAASAAEDDRDAAKESLREAEGYLKGELRVSKYITDIVDEKNQRFAEVLKNFLDCGSDKKGCDAAEVFQKVTQPEIQIFKNLAALAAVVNEEAKDLGIQTVKVKVNLFSPDHIKGEYIPLYSYPTDYSAYHDLEKLPLMKGVVGWAHREPGTKVISDIAKEIELGDRSNYLVDGKTPDSMKVGSIVVRPILGIAFDNEPVFLSVYIDNPGFFSDSSSQIKILKSQVLDPFTTRIKLELRLKKLKDMVDLT